MSRRSLALLLAAALAGCGAGSSPVDGSIGEGRISVQVGPGGRLLRGDGGTALEGFLLDIPAGALDRLVELTVEPGRPIELPGTRALTITYGIRVRPDPGVLRRPATLRTRVDVASFRRAEDIVVASRPNAARPTALAVPGDRAGVLADLGILDRDARTFEAEIRELAELQVRISDAARLSEDAVRLVQLGFESLSRLTDASLVQADLLFAEAQVADPFSATANLFRGVSRVLVALNDRRDSSPGLDSVGEILQRLGIDVRSESLASRLRTGSWPQNLVVPETAPSTTEVLDALRIALLPALELALRDFDRVPAGTELLIVLPSLVSSLPGERELDAADVLFLRSLLAAVIAIVELASDIDLDLGADLRGVTRRDDPLDLEELLARNPALGALRELPDERTLDALRAALFDFVQAFQSIRAEDDAQQDDLLVLPASFGAERFDLWQANLLGLQTALDVGGSTVVAFDGGSGSIVVEPLLPLSTGAFDPRRFAPEVFRFLPLAGTLPDPTLGGLFPDLGQDGATNLLRLPGRHALPRLPGLVADGLFADWPADAEALLPADPVGDAGTTGLTAVDLERLHVAETDDAIALRVGLAEGAIGFRFDQASLYRIRIEEVRERSIARPIDIEVVPLADRYEIRVGRDGRPRPVASTLGVGRRDFELLLDRFQLLDPDEPVTDRLVTVHSEALGLFDGRVARDRTRGVLVRF